MMETIPFGDLIGTPFEWRGRGPEKFDCYGCVMELRKRWGRPIPDYLYEIDNQPAAAQEIARRLKDDKGWRPCEIKVGAVLHFQILGMPSHVGIVVNKFDFVHCWELTSGVTKEKIWDWDKPHRLLGVYDYA
jgi:cell wall-associated NlpC family hydrolase